MARHQHRYASKRKELPQLLRWNTTKTTLNHAHDEDEQELSNAADHVAALEPVFVIPHAAVTKFQQWSYGEELDIS